MKSKLNTLMLGLTMISSIVYLIYNLVKKDVLLNFDEVMNSIILFVFSMIFVLYSLKNKDFKKSHMVTIGSIILSLYFIINTLAGLNLINLPSKETVGNFTNQSISEALDWAKANKVEVTQVYENSDTFPEYTIISQSVEIGTTVDKIKKISFVVSSGPSYEKTVIIPNMVGWDADKVLKFIKDNFLINVKSEFVTSDQAKDTLLSQDKTGEQRRDAEVNLSFSIGSTTDLGEIKMQNFVNKSLLEATFFMKRNGLNYTLEYQFSNSVNRNYIIKQSVDANKKVTNKDNIVITVSKGKEIVVPELLSMPIDEITSWVIDNKLKIKFEESYDKTIKLGQIISANYKNGDKIEEGTLIIITTSKGQLKVPNVNTISELRSWASSYNIALVENYDFNDTLANGRIVSMVPFAGEVIINGGSITVNVSQGKAIVIPNFIGKSKSSISSSCSTLGLNCTFSYSDYSSSALDTALSQNKKAGSTVVSGTYVAIGLSKGAAKTFTIEISESQLTIGNADKTISTLSSWFSSHYPSVTFSFIKKASNTYSNAGFIHESSPIKDGSSVTQGRTYQVWITN